jgi:integrase
MEYTGCRIGEAVVLQQKHIDIEHHKAAIVQDLAYLGQKPEVKPRPKTDAGDREIDLYDNVIEILPHYDDPETFVFFPDGLPTRSGLATAQKHYKKENGISATAHQLRHTYAGIMHSAEIDVKDTQARLGHANIAITQDIYTEIEKKHNEKVRAKANNYIMAERLKQTVKTCPACGSVYTKASDGHIFSFCPDCGKHLCCQKMLSKPREH